MYENQPSPFSEKFGGIWKTFAAFALALVILMIVFDAMSKKEPVFSSSYQIASGLPKAKPLSSPTSSSSPAALPTSKSPPPPTAKSWIYLNYALINQDTGKAWDFGREVSYYSGYDSDGYWSKAAQGYRRRAQRPPGTLLPAHRTGSRAAAIPRYATPSR